MRRRGFLKTGTLAGIGLTLSSRPATAEATIGSAPGAPVIVSTWRFGVGANQAAYRALERGASPIDAVESGVMVVEDDPTVTSVGIGGLPNAEGDVELDAAIMNGATLACGSVAALRRVRNPVAVARAVMERTPHVMLVGDGARRFALAQGFREEKLLTPEARRSWKQWKVEQRGTEADHDTIGMVALNADGRMAAACTTSGLAWKIPGRVGDSPLIGHGLYCDEAAGGAAATGLGEEVIRVCGSYQVVEFMRQGLSPDEAIRRVLERIVKRHRDGPAPQVGFVALRADGEVGYASIVHGFQAAVSHGGDHRLFDAPFLVQDREADQG